MTKLGKIYLIKNDLNNKVYVGLTILTLTKRFTGHCCYSKKDRSLNMYIKRAIHKYGKEHFKIELIEEIPIDDLNSREKYWILFYDSYNSGYNLTLGGLDSNIFKLNRLENIIDVRKFKEYIKEFRPLVGEVSSHFCISRCSVYNLIKRLNDPELILNSYNPRRGKSVNDIDTEELKHLYKSGWSIQDLVRKYHIIKSKISAYLKKEGIKIRRGTKGYKHRI